MLDQTNLKLIENPPEPKESSGLISFLTVAALVMAVISVFTLFASPAEAQQVKAQPVNVKMIQEEVVVVATDLSSVNNNDGVFKVGLSNTVLVHLYDKKTDSWKYVGTKLKSKKND